MKLGVKGLEKKRLRKEMKGKLMALSQRAREEIEEKLTSKLIHSTLWKHADTVGLTISRGLEWNTNPIIQTGWTEGKRVVIPRSFPESKELKFYQLEDYNQLQESFYNLLEPDPGKTEVIDKKEIDLLVVPGLLFDKEGYRIGFGGGYYDRFLANFSNQTVSIFYSEQLIEAIPYEEFDIPVQHLLTENGFC